ncbi:nose resistant to fluoxetine protein 6-like isoform X2 [Ostrea edulis]|uniref:nose resistant to fluoxetine protein 6-like isoform X2 n=1 Tax=Ostrea edulis TaxID=37623 RepID=UPI0024AFD677|nr:nose resistant to fluoxetine protein 6-like isoform X2 [Ostrea edulis]
MNPIKGVHFVVHILSFIIVCNFGSGSDLRYQDYAINPVGTLHQKIESQKAIAPFLSSKEFLEWTDQVSKHSLLKRANQIKLDPNALNSTNQESNQTDLSGLFQNLISELSNFTAPETNNSSQNNISNGGLGNVFQNILNNFLGSLSSNGNSSGPSNGSQNNSSNDGFGNIFQNILQNPNIGKFIGSMLGGGNTGVSSGLDFGKIAQQLTSGNIDPSTAGKMLMLYLNGIVQYTNASANCRSDVVRVISGLQSTQPWALKMLDASAKIPTGVMNLDLNWYGSYDECYSDVTTLEAFGILPTTQPPVNGQYCTVSLNLPLPPAVKGFLSAMQNPGAIKAGMCFPKSCSSDDLVKVVNAFLSNIPLGNSTVTAYPINCPTPVEDDQLETSDKIVVIILIVFLILIVTGTLYDVIIVVWPKIKGSRKEADNEKPIDTSSNSSDSNYKLRAENGEIQVIQQPKPQNKHNPSIFGRIILSFSAYTNGKKILGTSQPKGSLTAVNGIRFLSMSWVILGHTIAFILGNTSNFLTYYAEFLGRVSSQAIFNALVAVDTFFVLSGLLTSYLLLKQMSKTKGRINWFLFYFHRFWRLTPVYMMVIGMYVTIYPHLIFGPNKTNADETCKRVWWKNFLYIDNFFGIKDLCLGWSWYLNNDMQFYILSPLMIVPFYFNKIVGAMVSAVFLLIFTITPGVISYVNNLPLHTDGGGPKDADRLSFFEDYYIVPWCRMGPYICGVITGYLLYITKCKCRMNIFVNLLGWVVAAASASAVLYGIYDTVKPDNPVELSKEVTALYNAVNRTVWGAAVCWVIFACATGNGGYINTLLSWKAFVPLSRLTYCAYLVHPLVMYVYYLNRNFPFYLSDLDFVYIFLANLVVSYGMAFILSITFESPFMGLEKVMFSSRDKKEANSDKSLEKHLQ